jgi:hypothetical protein
MEEMNNRPLPKGDRIHCDPNRELGDTPARWNPHRSPAMVAPQAAVALLD